MRKLFQIILVLLVVAFAAIQFIQPEKNRGERTEAHLFNQNEISDDVSTLLQNACLDCHSGETNYLWFHSIAPVSWMVNNHITDGKEELNLSEWGEMEVLDQIGALDEMCEEVEKGNMPLKSYTFMHSKARLTEEQKKLLCDWAEKLSEELLVKMAN